MLLGQPTQKTAIGEWSHGCMDCKHCAISSVHRLYAWNGSCSAVCSGRLTMVLALGCVYAVYSQLLRIFCLDCGVLEAHGGLMCMCASAT